MQSLGDGQARPRYLHRCLRRMCRETKVQRRRWSNDRCPSVWIWVRVVMDGVEMGESGDEWSGDGYG